MRKWEETVTRWYIRGMIAWNDFKDSERGDTNFIAIALILAVVVILAGMFYAMGDTVMDKVKTSVENFVTNPANSVTK